MRTLIRLVGPVITVIGILCNFVGMGRDGSTASAPDVDFVLRGPCVVVFLVGLALSIYSVKKGW